MDAEHQTMCGQKWGEAMMSNQTRKAIDRLATAIEILAYQTSQIIGTQDAGECFTLVTEARQAVDIRPKGDDDE